MDLKKLVIENNQTTLKEMVDILKKENIVSIDKITEDDDSVIVEYH